MTKYDQYVYYVYTDHIYSRSISPYNIEREWLQFYQFLPIILSPIEMI